MSLLVFYSKRFRSSGWKTAAHVFIKKFDFVCVCSPFFAQVCVAMPVCEENGGQCSVSSSIGPHLIFWDTGAHRLAGLTGQDSFRVLLPQTDSSGITGVPLLLAFFFLLPTETPVQVLTPAHSVLRRSVISPSPCLCLWLNFLRTTSLAT